MSGHKPTARVVLRYGFDRDGRFRPEILAVDLLDVPPPLADFTLPEEAPEGAWLDVVAPGGELGFQVPVPIPTQGPEAADAEGRMVRRAPSRRHGETVAVEVPWFGPGSRIVFRHADGEAVATRSVPGLASLPLEPTPIERSRDAQGAVRLATWGHANARAIQLLFLAEAFRAEEAPAFDATVTACLDAIGAMLDEVSPGRDLRGAFAPVKLMLASRESGIGPKRGKTALLAHWATNDPNERLIRIDEAKVTPLRSAVAAGRSAQAIAIVNTSRYGGSGGATAVTSANPDAMGQVLVHELGHSLFQLGDEYVDEPRVRDMGEPVLANVTGRFTPATLKWRHMVTPGAALPTPVAHPMPAVGAYEGAFYASEGRFRPSFTCRMREVTAPFCPVCADAIRARLSTHL